MEGGEGRVAVIGHANGDGETRRDSARRPSARQSSKGTHLEQSLRLRWVYSNLINFLSTRTTTAVFYDLSASPQVKRGGRNACARRMKRKGATKKCFGVSIQLFLILPESFCAASSDRIQNFLPWLECLISLKGLFCLSEKAPVSFQSYSVRGRVSNIKREGRQKNEGYFGALAKISLECFKR